MLTQNPEGTPTLSESGIHTRIRAFVQQHALYRHRRFALAEDSTYIAALIGFIEQEFGVNIATYEITEENLGTLSAVARFVAAKQSFVLE
jgi:hypothetical protein